ncbi:MAG: hypothetical protein ACFFB6_10150 [Promethearchaeota archaeon]
MDPVYIIKLVSPFITGIIALIAGIIELRLNPKNWLNRWFFSFFLSASLGHLVYGIYHLIIINQILTSIAAIMSHIFINFIPTSLLMTVFVLEKFTKRAMSLKYLGTTLLIFILMSFGYFIWFPTPDPTLFTQGIINTTTPPPWFLFVNILRVALFGYILFEYAMITKKTEDETKQRIRLFFIGIFISVIGLISNTVGGIFDLIFFEILALILINVGAIIIVKGFFL